MTFAWVLSISLEISAFPHPCALCNPLTWATLQGALRNSSPVPNGADPRLSLTFLSREWQGLALTVDPLQTFHFSLLEVEDDRAVGVSPLHLGRGGKGRQENHRIVELGSWNSGNGNQGIGLEGTPKPIPFLPLPVRCGHSKPHIPSSGVCQQR